MLKAAIFSSFIKYRNFLSPEKEARSNTVRSRNLEQRFVKKVDSSHLFINCRIFIEQGQGAGTGDAAVNGMDRCSWPFEAYGLVEDRQKVIIIQIVTDSFDKYRSDHILS